MRKTLSAINYMFGGAGIMVSVADIEAVLSVVLLTCNIVLIAITVGFNVYDHWKNGRTKEAIDTLKDGVEDIKEVIENVDDKGKTK